MENQNRLLFQEDVYFTMNLELFYF